MPTDNAILREPDETGMPTPAPDALPDGDRLATVYEAVVDVASERLEAPVSVRLRTWEDGDIEVRVWHKQPHPDDGTHERDVIRYHSNTGVEHVLVAVDESVGEKTVITRETLDTPPAALETTASSSSRE